MIVVDVNLLLYAVVTGFPQHRRARSWWEAELNGDEVVGLATPTIFGFVRVATNPRALAEPLTATLATSYVTEWLEQPNVEILEFGRRHLDLAFDLLRQQGTAGNLTTDTQLAALAIEHGGTVYSNDTDFGRYEGLNWVNPLRPETY